jgi:streptomycin 6-kinase
MGFGRGELPAEVVDRWAEAYGRRVAGAWVEDVERRAAWCAATWLLHMEGFVPGGSLSCVLAARRDDGLRVVLKLLAPWAVDVIGSEALALSAWRGCGVVELLERSPDDRAMLLRRVRPGVPFAPSGDDGRDCERVARVLGAVASAPVVDGLPSLSVSIRARFTRARVAARGRRRIDTRELDLAEQRAFELARSASAVAAVHGDAQDKNLLVDGDVGALVAIDPEPAIGDPHFDTALWALTHRPGEGVGERCSVLAGLLGLDEDRLWAWCRVLVVAEVALDFPARAAAHRRFAAQA